MAEAPSRAYKLQLSTRGIDLFLRCHHRLCRAVGDLLPYGSTLLIAVRLLDCHEPEDTASVLVDPDLEPLGGRIIRYVGTSRGLSSLVDGIGQRSFETGLISHRPQVWKTFLAALSCMEDVTDSEIARCYHAAEAENRTNFSRKSE